MNHSLDSSFPFSVIIPDGTSSPPSKREISAAYLISNFLQADVIYLASSPDRRTPDFLIRGEYWELKTPTGKGKHNLEHCLKCAIRQSKNIIIDARFSKIHQEKIISQIKYHSRFTTKGIKKLLLITKSEKVIVIK